jgi:putative transposase
VRLAESNRRRKTRMRIARLHAQVGDLRADTIHRATTSIARSAQVICIEDLRVKALARGGGRKAFRRSVHDAALGEVRRQLEYKARWRGRTVIAVDKFYPSSKTCSGCGAVNADLKLKDRRWSCPACGVEHDRDINAALNIRNEGLRLLASPSPATGERPGSDVRGDAACAQTKTTVCGQPTSVNRKRSSKARWAVTSEVAYGT